MALVALLLMATCLLYRSAHFTRAATGQDAQKVRSRPRPKAAKEVDFPYYSVRDGFSSTLRLVSDSPEPLEFVTAIYSLSGQSVIAPAMGHRAAGKDHRGSGRAAHAAGGRCYG